MLEASNGASAGNGGWGYESSRGYEYPDTVTHLSPWGQTDAIPSRLALLARPAHDLEGKAAGPARARHAGKVMSHAFSGASLPTPEKW
jgi:hypothetical protein